MLFKLFRKKKEGEIKVGIQVGDRFAVRYSSLESCICYLDEHPYTGATITTSKCDLYLGDYDELYTVVEYIGDGQYLDLVTGMIFVKRVLDDTIKDTVTEEYQEEAIERKNLLIEHPISFRTSCELTTEIKKDIMDKTMPAQEEILEAIKKEEEKAREIVIDTYSEIDSFALKRQLLEKKRLEEEKRKEEEKRIREEEKRKREEEKIQAAIQLKAEVDPKFDQLFPKRLVIKK